MKQTTEGNVHILKGLGEHVYGDTIVTMVLKELDSGFGEGFVIPVVELHASLV